MNLVMSVSSGVEAMNAGLFISRGNGTHPTRRLDSHELIFVRGGVLSIREESVRFKVVPGHVLILFAGREHGGVEPYASDLSFYWVHFKITKGARNGVNGSASVPQFGPVARPERMTELFRYYLDDQESGFAVQQRSNLLVALMLSEATGAGCSLPEEAEENTLAFRARDQVITGYAEPLATSVIAGRLNCNPDYLGRVYKRVFGMSVTEAIHRRRVNVGKRLLMDSLDNVDEIAAACGFGSAHYFRRVFRKMEGMTPGAYRKLYSRVHVNTE